MVLDDGVGTFLDVQCLLNPHLGNRVVVYTRSKLYHGWLFLITATREDKR